MIKAFPIFKFGSGCDYHRIDLPFRYSHGLNDNDAFKGFTAERLFDFIAKADMVTYNRFFPLGTEAIMEAKEKYRFKVVVDLDDWVILPDHHPLYRQFKNQDAALIIENLKLADAVTVTTDRLYKKVKEFNKNTHVIPNAMPFGYEQFVAKPRPENELFNFIYTGQTSHLEDVRLLQATMNRVKTLKGVSVSLAGYKKNPVWDKMEQVFSVAPNYTRIENRDLYSYMDVYDESDCSLVPLCINDFNSCKSNLKLLEAAAKKIPAIVSWVPPYRDDAEAPVLWVKDPNDWFKHMKYLSENREAAKQLGNALFQWANEKYNLLKWNKTRFQIYEK